MATFEEAQYFAGLVASGQEHGVSVLDRNGARVTEFEFDEFGWRDFQAKLAEYPGVMLAAEAMQGRVMDQLLMRGFSFFPVTPQNLAENLKRLAYPEDESVQLDARGLAEALRLWGGGWKPLTPQEPLLPTFRQIWAREKDLRANLVFLLGQLGEALSASFPEVLPVFGWSSAASWAFVESYPLASVLRRAKKHEIEKFIRAHELWETPCREQCLEIFARVQQGNPGFEPRHGAGELQEMARTISRCAAEWHKFQYLSAGILQSHPDFAMFGPPPAEEKPVII